MLIAPNRAVIIEASDLIRKCLNCVYFKEDKCDDKERLIKFLDLNQKQKC
jgi:hypothetical protein